MKGERQRDMCEKYNGWANRETWALHLWLSNDDWSYESARDRVAVAIGDESDPRRRERLAGEAVKALWEELTDPGEDLLPIDRILRMTRDIGSEYRVEWDEIGAAWLEDVQQDNDTESGE